MNSGDSLYQDAIKQFAQAAHGHGTLENATGEAKLNNPLCGDRVRMQVALDAGRIAAIAHETKRTINLEYGNRLNTKLQKFIKF